MKHSIELCLYRGRENIYVLSSALSRSYQSDLIFKKFTEYYSWFLFNTYIYFYITVSLIIWPWKGFVFLPNWRTTKYKNLRAAVWIIVWNYTKRTSQSYETKHQKLKLCFLDVVESAYKCCWQNTLRFWLINASP